MRPPSAFAIAMVVVAGAGTGACSDSSGSDDDVVVDASVDAAYTGLPPHLRISADVVSQGGWQPCSPSSSTFEVVDADYTPRLLSANDSYPCSFTPPGTLHCANYIVPGDPGSLYYEITIRLNADLSGGTGSETGYNPGGQVLRCQSTFTITRVEVL